MVLLRIVAMVGGVGCLTAAAYIVVAEVVDAMRARRAWEVRWRKAARLTLVAFAAFLPALAIVVVPSGMAAVRVSQLSGTLPGTLYPGTHLVVPFLQRAEVFDVRDRVFATSAAETADARTPVLKVYTREGLPVGLGISVRYQLDPARLSYLANTMPEPIERDIMPAVVAAAFRQTIAAYPVHDVFSARREDVRREAADTIAKHLDADAVVVKEVMLRDISLPPEYAKGLEGLLLKMQENDRLSIELEVKQKMVHGAELEAEAQEMRRVKEAEGRAQITVLEAKAQADAMQHTLPLKEKQIQQSRLEAEARKEATVKNAEAAAAAKVIDSRAELEKRNLLAQADAQRVRVMAVADAERMKSEAQVLNASPLLIQKIVAERLSDKVQIMMVPMDGKFFFTNDVLKTTPIGGYSGSHPDQR